MGPFTFASVIARINASAAFGPRQAVMTLSVVPPMAADAANAGRQALAATRASAEPRVGVVELGAERKELPRLARIPADP